MPRAGDEFDAVMIDHASTANVVRMTTYRYRSNGRTVDPVKIVERRVKSVELRLSPDPWQPATRVYHYGKETTWCAETNGK